MRQIVVVPAKTASVVFASSLLSGVAWAALGDLDPQGCIEETGFVSCADEAPGLEGATAVAVSPNGRSLYVASFDGSSVARFDRELDGSLDPEGCFDDIGGSGCASEAAGLGAPTELVVSPDGENLYVVSGEPGAIVTFNRQASGAISADGCIQDDSSNSFCEDTGGNTPGLRSANGVAISPDGDNVYVAAFLSDGIAIFDRSGNGTLTPAGCIQNTGRTECGETTPGLDGAFDVVVSEDGEHVYVASFISDAVVAFDRASDGSLTPAGCIQNQVGTTCEGSFGESPALNGARALALSPDGDHLYVAGFDDDTVTTLDVAPDGDLSHASCVQNTGGTACGGAGNTSAGLDNPSSIAVSPDGEHVYVASTLSDALVAFDRAGDGTLEPDDCIQNTGKTECTGAGGSTTAGLDGAVDVTLSPVGNSVYVASFNSSAVVVFDRETPATTTTSTTVTIETTTTTEPEPLPECGDANGNGEVNSTDALVILRAAVGGNQCDDEPCICNVAGGPTILTSDAQQALRIAVGQNVTPQCNC